MITAPDFDKKQILFVMPNEGEKMAISNDNLVIKDKEGKIKFQITCYRVYLVFVLGSMSITTVLIQKAKKHGFYIALMTSGFHLYSVIGAPKEGNVLLRKQQYNYCGVELAKHITKNKINNQIAILKKVRHKNELLKETLEKLESYVNGVECVEDNLQSVLGYEGLASKIYFKNHFDNVVWKGRQPRLKKDYVNSTLDIGYTLLFSFVDALLESFGFDTYVGVMHTQFYMRKSLVCDIVEPFRPLIDKQVKKGINLNQIREEDFKVIKNQYQLKWENNKKYVSLLIEPLMERKVDIFKYIHEYYRAFMKKVPAEKFPVFEV